MKKFKGLLMAVLVIGLIMVALAGCDGHGGGKFTITTTYNSAKGTVTVEPQKELYASGEKVVIKAQAKDGYVIQSAYLDSNNVTRDLRKGNGKYSFEINRNRTFKVEFVSADEANWDYLCNVSYRASQGDVTVEPKKDGYFYGDEVTITVKPKKDSELSSFTVNGTNVTSDLNDGIYKLTVKEDIDIAIRFKQDFTVMRHPTTLEAFEKEIDCDGKVIVDFWAECCPPCRAFSPVLDSLVPEGIVKIVKVEVYEGDWIPRSELYNIFKPYTDKYGAEYGKALGIPFIILVEDGEVVKTSNGPPSLAVDDFKKWCGIN